MTTHSPFKTWITRLPSAREKFFVVRDDRRWKVRHNDHLCGPYISFGGALRAAMDKAVRAGRRGGGAQVFVQVKGDEFRLEWTYGLDPIPSASG